MQEITEVKDNIYKNKEGLSIRYLNFTMSLCLFHNHIKHKQNTKTR